MPTATRRSSQLPPSSLAAKVLRFAHGTGVGPGKSNQWLGSGIGKMYVRRSSNPSRLDLANWQIKAKEQGKGHAKQLLTFFEDLMRQGQLPQKVLHVESVHNPRFREHW